MDLWPFIFPRWWPHWLGLAQSEHFVCAFADVNVLAEMMSLMFDFASWCHFVQLNATIDFNDFRRFYTPGNVVRGNQKLCKWKPYGSSQPWLTDLQTVNKQVNAPWILLFVNVRKSGNVVPNSFDFCARWNEYGSWKSSCVFLDQFLPAEV